MTCLLVVPHFRHLAHLQIFLPTLLKTLPPGFDILVSDDGSGEFIAHSLQVYLDAEQANLRKPGPAILKPLLAKRNRGKGHAVYSAWQMIGDSYDWLAFVDADGAIEAAEILRAWNYLLQKNENMDALLASRVAMLGMKVVRTPSRHYAGRIFATIVSTLTGLKIYDTQCGLKFVRASAFQKINTAISTDGFAFDVELLALLAGHGSRMEEFPINWKDIKGGKVIVWRDSLPMLWEVFKICAAKKRRIRHCQ